MTTIAWWDPPWWADLDDESRWYQEYLHINAEHVLGRRLRDVSDKVSGGGIVGSKCFGWWGEFAGWVDLTDPHDAGPPWPDLSRWPNVDPPPWYRDRPTWWAYAETQTST